MDMAVPVSIEVQGTSLHRPAEFLHEIWLGYTGAIFGGGGKPEPVPYACCNIESPVKKFG